ncbi:hypothetical protein AB0H37_24645 [Actinomadura sp. NPDC023710]|uniref:hypothetical protein n=1 Tax=Actinomadura sp. NPDC023710 TaxID=3158219 RepID=UPI003407FB57
MDLADLDQAVLRLSWAGRGRGSAAAAHDHVGHRVTSGDHTEGGDGPHLVDQLDEGRLADGEVLQPVGVVGQRAAERRVTLVGCDAGLLSGQAGLLLVVPLGGVASKAGPQLAQVFAGDGRVHAARSGAAMAAATAPPMARYFPR